RTTSCSSKGRGAKRRAARRARSGLRLNGAVGSLVRAPELLRRASRKLWQGVLYREPGCLGSGVDVHNGSNDGVVIEGTGGNDDVRPVVLEHGKAGSADLAERSEVAGRRLVAPDAALPGEPAELGTVRVEERSECAAVRLATHRAVAVV